MPNTFRKKHPFQWTQADTAEAIAAGHYKTPMPFARYFGGEDQNLRDINRKVAGLGSLSNRESKNYDH